MALYDHQDSLKKQYNRMVEWLNAAEELGTVADWNPYGSFRIPGSNAKDVDFIVLWASCLDKAKHYLNDSGWVLASDAEYEGADEDVWFSARLGDANLIVTCDRMFYEDGVRASDLCFALGLTDKNDRIVLHAMVQDDLDLESALARRKV